jgi:hypothetical protein
MRNQALQIMVAAYGPPKKGQVCLLSFISLNEFEKKFKSTTNFFTVFPRYLIVMVLKYSLDATI